MYRTNPWTIEPSYVKLLGFHVSMIVPDLLHAYNLGVGRDVVGSILAIILRDARVFRGESLADRLAVASQGLRGFAKRHSYPLRLKKLTKSKLGIKRGQYPTLASSGYDTFVVATWLEGVLQEHVDVHGDLATLLWASNRALSLQYSAGWFLTEAEKNSIQSLGSIFLDTYISLAKGSLQRHEFLFRVRPKLHLMSHVFSSMRGVNQSKYSTWMDEDFLKKIGRTFGLTSGMTGQKRVLQRWLMAIPLNFQKHFGAYNASSDVQLQLP